MKWVGFGASAASVAPCVGAKGGSWSVVVFIVVTAIAPWSSCFVSFFRGAIAALILQESPRPSVLYFRDLDFAGASFPVKECPFHIEYHVHFAPADQQIAWLKCLLLS